MLYPQKPKITGPLKPMPDKSMSKNPNKKLEALKIALQKKAQMGRIKE